MARISQLPPIETTGLTSQRSSLQTELNLRYFHNKGRGRRDRTVLNAM